MSLTKLGKSTSKSDVWAFGVVLWEIFTYGNKPYPLLTNEEVAQQVSNGYRMTPSENCPAEVKELMQDCWKQNPDERPTFANIYDKLDAMYRSEIAVEGVEEQGTGNEYGTSAIRSNQNTGGLYNA